MQSFRIAILADPLTLAGEVGLHVPALARELLGRGHMVRGFGGTPGAIPRSGLGPDSTPADEALTPAAWAPDVVLAYEAFSPASYVGARTAKKLRIPLLVVDLGHERRGVLPMRFLRGVGEVLWGRKVRQLADRVIAIDPLVVQEMKDAGFEEDRIHLLPVGVDPNRFRPGLSSQLVARHKVSGRVILYAGKLTHEAGVDLLIHAFARTVGQRGDWSLVIAGYGPQQSKLRAQADQLGVAGNIHWLPRPRPEELPGLLGSSTLFAVPALAGGSRGMLIPRAMACGLPVIVSATPRMAFHVDDGENGLLVAPGDLDAWVQALARACGSPEARRRWGRLAVETARERYSWARIAEHVESLALLELASHSPGGAGPVAAQELRPKATEVSPAAAGDTSVAASDSAADEPDAEDGDRAAAG